MKKNRILKYKAPARQKKCRMTQKEKEDAVILKFRNNEAMSLDEAALALWMSEGRKGKPMTRMGLLKMEQRILVKLAKTCQDRGLNKAEVIEMLHGMNKNEQRENAVGFGNSIDGNWD